MLVRVKRLKRDFPLHQVNSAILQAVRTLGYDRPTEDQRDAIRSFVEGVDVFVSLPTGSGKSLCYACLPVLFDVLRGDVDQQGSIVVVSPLSSLMQDQVCWDVCTSALVKMNIIANLCNSALYVVM